MSVIIRNKPQGVDNLPAGSVRSGRGGGRVNRIGPPGFIQPSGVIQARVFFTFLTRDPGDQGGAVIRSRFGVHTISAYFGGSHIFSHIPCGVIHRFFTGLAAG